MRKTFAVVFFLAFPDWSSSAVQADEFHLTEQEKAACTGDAERLCANTYPDETKLLVCMKDNAKALSANCAAVFMAGLKRRHL